MKFNNGGVLVRILITNDDGVNAKGIYVLARELEKDNEVIVAAPSEQQSACSHSITISRPIVVKEVKLKGLLSKAYSVSGTPADCVKIGIDKICQRKVDVVISGINRGVNIGTDILYSGTVSAAIEASINNIPSMAVSLDESDDDKDYETAVKYVFIVLDKIKKTWIEKGLIYNLNVPRLPYEKIKGIKVCKMGSRVFDDCFIETESGYESKVSITKVTESDSDRYYISKGYVTLTPLFYDLTDFRLMKETEDMFK